MPINLRDFILHNSISAHPTQITYDISREYDTSAKDVIGDELYRVYFGEPELQYRLPQYHINPFCYNAEDLKISPVVIHPFSSGDEKKDVSSADWERMILNGIHN